LSDRRPLDRPGQAVHPRVLLQLRAGLVNTRVVAGLTFIGTIARPVHVCVQLTIRWKSAK